MAVKRGEQSAGARQLVRLPTQCTSRARCCREHVAPSEAALVVLLAALNGRRVRWVTAMTALR
ncbi:hypothetical protein BRM76_09045 [Xanthomonas oryzae pv. oryzae]|nr:hypothetical protein BRM95_11030 [Xanthomonas oryzae pv. oryzae]RBG06389.1 hypothetical protein BRM76_09045 [Xanthomonas oryzae pv. oryzae]